MSFLMFDGVKLRIKDDRIINNLFKNVRLKWCKNEEIKTRHIISYYAEYKGLHFTIIKKGYAEINGSLHKYFNDGIHNADDFTKTKLDECIKRLESEFGINPEKTTVNNLEFGVNLNTTFNPNDLLNNLLCFAWNRFNDIKFEEPGIIKQCSPSTQYLIKIYNKALHQHFLENILRIEKRVTTMVALKWSPIVLSDLLNPKLWEHCHHELISMFNTIIINESLDINLLTKKELSTYISVINQSNWEGLDRDKKKHRKRDFNYLISQYGQQQFKPNILNLIDKKCIELLKS